MKKEVISIDRDEWNKICFYLGEYCGYVMKEDQGLGMERFKECSQIIANSTHSKSYVITDPIQYHEELIKTKIDPPLLTYKEAKKIFGIKNLNNAIAIVSERVSVRITVRKAESTVRHTLLRRVDHVRGIRFDSILWLKTPTDSEKQVIMQGKS